MKRSSSGLIMLALGATLRKVGYQAEKEQARTSARESGGNVLAAASSLERAVSSSCVTFAIVLRAVGDVEEGPSPRRSTARFRHATLACGRFLTRFELVQGSWSRVEQVTRLVDTSAVAALAGKSLNERVEEASPASKIGRAHV